jgi:hypothetical protein
VLRLWLLRIRKAIKQQQRDPKYCRLFILAGLLAMVFSGCQSTREPVTFKLPTSMMPMLPSGTIDSHGLTQSIESQPIQSTLTSTIEATATPLPSFTMSLPPSDTPSATATLNETEIIEASYTTTPSLTATLTPTLTKTRYRYITRTPTMTPTATATLTPTPPFAQLRIQKPGPYSKVVSPFQVEAMIHPGEDGFVRIQIVGEDSRIISSQLLNYANDIKRRFWIAPQITFEISGVAETARLELIALDQSGRPMDIFTLDLILLKLGKNELVPAEISQEPYIIRYPPAEELVRGGKLWVSGLIRPVNPGPITIELLNEENEKVGQSVFQVAPPSGDLSHTPFAIEIPYQVETLTPVRAVIYQSSDKRIPGIVHLSSFLLTLAP